MFCTLSLDVLHLCEFLLKYLNGFQLTELTQVHGRNCHFQYLLYSKGSNSKSRLTRGRVLVFCTSYYGASHLWEISWKCIKRSKKLQNGHEYMVKMAMFNVQREISPKVGKSVHGFCMLYHRALNLGEVSSKYLKQFPIYRADTSTW